MMKIGGIVLLWGASCQMAGAFSFVEMESQRMSSRMQKHYMSIADDIMEDIDDSTVDGSDSRRNFFLKVGTAAVAAASGNFGGLGVLAPEPANAVGGFDKVNAKLRGYGLPLAPPAPGGFTPLLELYGRGKNRFPILVQFNQPITWVLTLPSNDMNSEDGTVQAGEYAKGDTATFFVYEGEGNVKNIASAPKDLFERTLIKAISQKGSNVYQNFKVTKVVPQTGPEYNGQEYVIVDFKYELLTGAGFEVDRKGVAAITSQGPAIEALWTASTSVRYKKTEDTLREITKSFRCYVDGINFSDELYRYGDA